MFGKLLGKFRERWERKWRRDIDALEDELAHLPHERDIETLVPIILPRTCLCEDWPGPIVPIGTLPFAVAWATVTQQTHFHYVNHEQADYWQNLGIDWRDKAMRNLGRLSENQRWAGEKSDEAGKPFVLALIHDDAIGPSRLLLPNLFDDILGADYRVAIPEQTCAIAYKCNLSADEQSDVDGMINGCFEHGTEPMSSERFSPAEFWIFNRGHDVRAP
jgi:hypothetical protein